MNKKSRSAQPVGKSSKLMSSRLNNAVQSLNKLQKVRSASGIHFSCLLEKYPKFVLPAVLTVSGCRSHVATPFKMLYCNFILIWERNLYGEQQFTRKTFPGLSQSPHHWRFSRCNLTGYEIISSRFPFPWKAGIDSISRSLPSGAIICGVLTFITHPALIQWLFWTGQREEKKAKKIIKNQNKDREFC